MSKGYTYKQAMIHIMQLCDSFGYSKSRDDLTLKVPWRTKTMGDGSTLTLWFRPQSIYYVRNNNLVRHLNEARSLHLEDIKLLAKLSRVNPTYVIDYLEGRTT